MATHQIRIGDDCVKILDAWRYPEESLSDAIRRINRHLGKHNERGINSK
jgi:hypothetical protein